MKQTIFEEYAIVKMKIKELEDTLEVMKPEIRRELEGMEDMKTKLDFGTFSVVKRTRYVYSEMVEELEKALKKAKREEEEMRIAVPSYTEELRFTPSRFGVPSGSIKF